MNIGKYIELYSEDLRMKNYSNNTIQNYVSQVKFFLEFYYQTSSKEKEMNGRTTGFEPANDGVTIHCLTTWLRPPFSISNSLLEKKFRYLLLLFPKEGVKNK